MAGNLKKLKKSLSRRFSFQSHSSSSASADAALSLSDSGSTDIASQVAPPSPSLSSALRSRGFSFRSPGKICAICLGSLKAGKGQAIFTAECSHPFHFNCIAANVRHGNRICPICRSQWKDIPFQAPSNSTDSTSGSTSRTRPSSNAVPRQDIRFSGSLRDFQPTFTPQLTLESDSFSDDEPLPAIDPGVASSPCPRAITIKASPEFPAVLASNAIPKFDVLVGIRAPPFHANSQQFDRAPIDLVTVLDVSGSMDKSLALLKRAVRFIIENLGPSDRLSIVAFSSSARRIMPLRRMSNSGRDDAICAVNSLSSGGCTNIVEGLTKGVRVLEARREHNPVTSIILLTDGCDTYNVSHSLLNAQNQTSNSSHQVEYLNLLPALIRHYNSGPGRESQGSTIPVHTFGFGMEHDSNAMHAISDASGGTFSFIESNDILQEALARCVGGLLSVVAQDVRLRIGSMSHGVQIHSIVSGKYTNAILNQGQEATIDIGNLYADEEKEFLLNISIPASSHAEGDQASARMPLLDVLCSYKDSGTLETVQSVHERVEILRPDVLSPSDTMVSLEVDRQRNRLCVAQAIANAQQLAEEGALEQAQALLAEQSSVLLSSASAQAEDGLCNWLEAELREISERMATRESYEHTGRAYALSGLSSLSWQRATTRGHSTTIITTGVGANANTNRLNRYETPSMANMVSKSQILNYVPQQQQQQQHQRHARSCSLHDLHNSGQSNSSG